MENFPLSLELIGETTHYIIYSGVISLLPILKQILIGIHHYFDYGKEFVATKIWKSEASRRNEFDFIVGKNSQQSKQSTCIFKFFIK